MLLQEESVLLLRLPTGLYCLHVLVHCHMLLRITVHVGLFVYALWFACFVILCTASVCGGLALNALNVGLVWFTLTFHNMQ